MQWPAIPLETPVGELAGKHVAAAGVGVLGKPTLALMSLHQRRGGKVRVTCMDVGLRSDPPPMAQTSTVPAEASLALVLSGLGQIRATSAGEVPDVVWPGTNPTVLDRALTFGSCVAGLIAGVLLQSPLILLITVTTTISIYLVNRRQARPIASMPPYVREGNRQLLASVVLSRLGQALPPGASPTQRVAQVKAVYGQLLSDVVYRIENSALFDPAVEATQRFQLALLAWDPSASDAAELADEVEAAFAAARDHAQRLGLEHLPETARATGRRAVRAAQVALGSDSAAERVAAGRQVAQLVDSLGLYWLPSIDAEAPALIGRRKMIEPAP